MQAWFRAHRFPLLLAALLIALEVGLVLLLQFGAGPDRVWLGDTIQNSSDQAVYLSDIEQIRDGAWSMQNLFAPGPQAPFWHPFYLLPGLLARFTGWSAIWSHELFRWLSTLGAVLLLHAVSRRLVESERDARLGTVLAVFGGGLGWLYAIGQSALQIVSHDVIPDLTGETFFFPTLLMGAHVPIAFALFTVALERLWRGFRGAWMAFIALLIQPYFAPILLGLAAGVLVRDRKHLPWRNILLWSLAVAAPIVFHLWQLSASSHRFLLTGNDLPIRPFLAWFLGLGIPLLVAAWRIKKLPLTASERWLVAWIIAAGITILLPWTWDRKLTLGLGTAALLIARPLFARRPLFVTFFCLSSLSLVLNQIAWSGGTRGRGDELFASRDLTRAWQWIREQTPPDAIVLADDAWIGTWIPAKTLRRSWIGHKGETPDWEAKRALLSNGSFPLNEADVFLTHEAETADRWQARLGPPAVRFGNVALWYTRKP